ncbi:MAG: hypothetical protein NC312_14785, partial [Bacteroides fragilis]|nr:hypothetical protein [Bacteroides fragilis]
HFFLIVNNKLFFPPCQSPNFDFSLQNISIGIFNAMGELCSPLNYSIAAMQSVLWKNWIRA